MVTDLSNLPRVRKTMGRNLSAVQDIADPSTHCFQRPLLIRPGMISLEISRQTFADETCPVPPSRPLTRYALPGRLRRCAHPPDAIISSLMQCDSHIFPQLGEAMHAHTRTPHGRELLTLARSRTGRKGPYAHYYLQVGAPNESFIGE
jgi:hypothetical protein